MMAEQDRHDGGDTVEPPEPAGSATDGPVAADPSIEDAAPAAEAPVAYEIVYECRDKMLGGRLAQRLEDVVGPTWQLRRVEEGPSWALVIEFPSPASANRFFDSEFYRQFCIEARRSCRSSVLVVPLGKV